jgi:hypothetical protein
VSLFIMVTSSTVVSVAINDVGWVGYTKGVTFAVGDRCHDCGVFIASKECLALWECLSVLQQGFHALLNIMHT